MVTMTEQKQKTYGWELHCTAGTSDKYYRVMVVCHDEQWAYVANYGRRNTSGSWKVHTFASMEAALAKAQSMTDEKTAKGYQVTRDFTEFDLSDEFAEALVSGVNSPVLVKARAAAAHSFRHAALQQGTVREGAAR